MGGFECRNTRGIGSHFCATRGTHVIFRSFCNCKLNDSPRPNLFRDLLHLSLRQVRPLYRPTPISQVPICKPNSNKARRPLTDIFRNARNLPQYLRLFRLGRSILLLCTLLPLNNLRRIGVQRHRQRLLRLFKLSWQLYRAFRKLQNL